ncbi:MAG TPA: hypothetical protein VG756_08285 [Pseudonocardiaceae bacterium]|nr:hypothetical protein [Pseudonocardiaceae bacterium]
MYGNLIVNSWVGIHEGCDLTCSVNGSDGAYFMANGKEQPFEFFFDFAALSTFVELGNKALAEMTALAEQDEAEWAREQAEHEPTADRPA